MIIFKILYYLVILTVMQNSSYPNFLKVMHVCIYTYDSDDAGEFLALHLPMSQVCIFFTLAYIFHNKYYQ